MSLSKLYATFLCKYPVLSQGVQAGLIMGAGDVLAQKGVEKKKWEQYSFARTAQFASLGLFLVGPALRIWYGVLAKQFGQSKQVTVTLKKVACDQLLFAPVFTGFFLSVLWTTQGKSWSETKTQLRNNYPDVMLMNYQLWPAAQLINFYVMPLHYQVLFAQFVALVWNTYVSWKTHV